MNTIFESKYLIIKEDIDASLIYWEWLPASEFLIHDLYTEQCKHIINAYVGSSCYYIIDNSLNMKYELLPGTESKISKEFFMVLKGRLDKIAHIVPEDSIEISVEEQEWKKEKYKLYNEKFFTNLSDAQDWILKK